ncbi:MAG: sel1 repeat family protein [Lentisphaerae bacterium]|nr:sel1 repeat family protein [Lentisphaerota bacterium]
MSLKRILSAALLLAGLTAFCADAPKAGGTALADEISAVLKGKKVAAGAAVKELKALSSKNGQAAALLGLCYKDGYGTAVSLPAARNYFLTSAKQGNAIGQFWAGFFLLRGIGGAADVPKGVDLLESSAVQGISNAMVLLAHVYLEGYTKNGRVVIREDHPLAVRYLRRAAAGGNKEAAMVMGDWFFKGGMLKNDPAQAREWYVLAGHRYSDAAVAEVDYEAGQDENVKKQAWEKLAALANAGNARAQVYVAGVALKKGDVSRAAALAESAAKHSYPPALTLKALIAKQKGQKNWLDLMLKAAAAGDPEALALAGAQLAAGRGSISAKGVEMLERAARRGVPAGLVKMGRIYLQGRLVPRDEFQAFDLFKKAAAKGNVESKYFLSLCYRDGLGCRANHAQAAQLAFEAAEAGDSYAQTLYATYLRDGIGVSRDSNRAVQYLQKAVMQGNVHAQGLLSDLISKANDIAAVPMGDGLQLVQKAALSGDAISAYSLGRIYTEGVKVKRDYAQGRKNYELAVARKHPEAFAALAEYYLNGWGVSKNYKKAIELVNQGKKFRSGRAYVISALCKLNGYGVKKDIPGALRDFRQGAALRDAAAELWLGICHVKGIGVAVNEATAYAHFRRAAALGNNSGMLMLALCYRDGIGVKKNLAASQTYLKRAAEAGNADALYELGLVYANGVHGPKDMAKAIKCYRAAAEKGNAYGIYELACCYENGRGVEKDVSKAAALYRISATAGNRYAQFMLARCYEGGIGVPQDKYEAVRWYKKAAAGGFKYAARRAAELQKKLDTMTL